MVVSPIHIFILGFQSIFLTNPVFSIKKQQLKSSVRYLWKVSRRWNSCARPTWNVLPSPGPFLPTYRTRGKSVLAGCFKFVKDWRSDQGPVEPMPEESIITYQERDTVEGVRGADKTYFLYSYHVWKNSIYWNNQNKMWLFWWTCSNIMG